MIANKISAALANLNRILPLAERQCSLSAEAIQAHHEILHAYAHTGTAPSDINTEILTQLQQLDLIVLDGSGGITGAYPFTSETRVHRVDIDTHTAHCMCALDALAISPMFECSTTVHSKCILTSKPIKIEQSGLMILNLSECEELFFAIDWAAVSGTACCANSLCKQMNFIVGADRARDWLKQSKQHELFSLNEAAEFSARFFVPLMSPDQQVA